MWPHWIVANKRGPVVSELLSPLPSDYVLLSNLALPECRTKVDHVVVGPNGLFMIEINDQAGDFRCEGHDWFIDRRRIPSLSRQAMMKAASLRKTLVSVTYDGENKIPAVGTVLAFTSRDGKITVREPAVPAMRAEELAAFILHSKVAEIGKEDRQTIIRHLVSFQSQGNGDRRRGFLGLRLRRAGISTANA